jgi:hypothetical protein
VYVQQVRVDQGQVCSTEQSDYCHTGGIGPLAKHASYINDSLSVASFYRSHLKRGFLGLQSSKTTTLVVKSLDDEEGSLATFPSEAKGQCNEIWVNFLVHDATSD